MAGLPNSEGAILPIFAIAIFSLFGITGLTVDASSLYAEKRHGQNVADTAAYAAAVDLMNGQTTAAEQSAKEICRRNGYDNNQSTNKCQVNIPPQAGEHVGDSNFAEVVLWKQATTYFSKIVSGKNQSVTSRGVAGFKSQAASGVGLLVLGKDPGTLQETLPKALHTKGGFELTVENASIVVNSSAEDESSAQGNAVLMGTSSKVVAPAMDINGGYKVTGGADISGVTITTHAGKHLDPLANLPAPNCDFSNPKPGLRIAPSDTSWHRTLRPGTYEFVNAANDSAIYIEVGIYCILGDFKVGRRTDVQMIADGSVPRRQYVFYAPGKTMPSPGGVLIYMVGEFKVGDHATVKLKAPTEGPYQGIALFRSRNATKGTGIMGIELGGVSELQIEGTIYAPMPGSKLLMKQKTTTTAVISQIIVNEAVLSTGSLKLSWEESGVARVLKPILVE